MLYRNKINYDEAKQQQKKNFCFFELLRIPIWLYC